MKPTVRIRAYAASDAAALAEVFRRSVTGIGPRDYSAAQVLAWASRTPSPQAINARYTDGRTALVATDDADQPIAFGDLEQDGHVDFMYCAPEAAGRGVASALYDQLEAAARAGGLTRIYTEASEAARRLFERKGFVVTARRDLIVAGTHIHNFAMEKQV